jgi:Sulfotransferase domain
MRQRKIFVVSLHRSGTQSVDDLFIRSGLKSIHWPVLHGNEDFQARVAGRETDLDYVADTLGPIVDDYEALSDMPICALYDVFAVKYPEAVFIAAERPAEDWIRSVRWHIGTRELLPYEKVGYWRYLRFRPERLADASDCDLADMHFRHHAELQSFFRSSGRLNLVQLGDPRAGEEICSFLGVPLLTMGNVDCMRQPVVSPTT